MGHMSTCGQFCDTLVNATSGLVKRGSDTGKKGGATSSAKKRPNPQDNGEPPKKKPKESKVAHDAVEDEIANSFIGECIILSYIVCTIILLAILYML